MWQTCSSPTTYLGDSASLYFSSNFPASGRHFWSCREENYILWTYLYLNGDVSGEMSLCAQFHLSGCKEHRKMWVHVLINMNTSVCTYFSHFVPMSTFNMKAGHSYMMPCLLIFFLFWVGETTFYVVWNFQYRMMYVWVQRIYIMFCKWRIVSNWCVPSWQTTFICEISCSFQVPHVSCWGE